MKSKHEFDLSFGYWGAGKSPWPESLILFQNENGFYVITKEGEIDKMSGITIGQVNNNVRSGNWRILSRDEAQLIVSGAESRSVKVSEDYVALINDNGSVRVGCQHVEFETLKELYEKALKVKES